MLSRKEFLLLGIIVTSTLLCALAYQKRNEAKLRFKNDTAITQPEPELPKSKPEPKPEPAYTFQNALDSIKADDLKKSVEFLANECDGRKTGTPGIEKARDFLVKELQSAGLETKIDTFKIIGATGDNVYAWIEGVEDSLVKDDVVVVGAHYDHLGKKGDKIYSGADDNASGTVAVLSMAKALAKMKGQNKRTVVFQFYAGEELGLLGSEFYVKNPKFPLKSPSIKKHIFMENLDMIGHGNFEAASALESPVSGLINKFKDKYPFAAKVTNAGGNNGSDHAPFRNARVPVLMLHTGLHNLYHTSADKPDTLNYKNMEKITQYGLDLAWEVCQNGIQVKASDVQVESDMFLDHGITPFEKIIDHAIPERETDELPGKN